MGEWFKRLWARLESWLDSPYLFGYPRPPAAPPAPPPLQPKPVYTEIVGAEYLKDYQEHYKQFQAAFLAQMRRTPDAQYWKDAPLREVAVFGGKWAQTAYDRVPDDERIIWWVIDEPSYTEWEAKNAHLPGLRRTWSGSTDV